MKHVVKFFLPALLFGVLASCASSKAETTEEGLVVLPTSQEYGGNKMDALHLSPSIETSGGTRISFRKDFELRNDDGELLSWQDIGVDLKATVTFGEDGKAKKAVVHGNTDDSIYLWHGEVITDGVSAYFKTPNYTFMYVENWTQETLPEHVVMRHRGHESIVLDIGISRSGSSIMYSPNPSGFAGYVNLDALD